MFRLRQCLRAPRRPNRYAGDWLSLEPRQLLSAAFWQGFARDPQHTATSPVGSLPLTVIRWQTPVDENPQYQGSRLLEHLGSPLVTTDGTVIVTVKTGATG